MKSGKLQVFYDNEFLFSATLRKVGHDEFVLRIYDENNDIIYKRTFCSAEKAKSFLENFKIEDDYGFYRCRWYTERGFVCDEPN